MTNSPNSHNQPDPNPAPRPRWRSRLLQAGLITGGVVIVAGAAGARWAWVFVHEQLAPLVETSLSQSLDRPLALGQVERFSLTGITLGPSMLPATTTDADEATVDAVEVRFNLLNVLLSRTLRLDVTLVRPTLFIDQTEDGEWIATRLREGDGEAFIKIQLDQIRVQNGSLVLAPFPRVSVPTDEIDRMTVQQTVAIDQLTGSATFTNDNNDIAFDVTGMPTSGGNLRIKGETRLEEGETNLLVQGQDLQANVISSLLPLPLSMETGLLAANMTVEFRPDQPLALYGTTQFRDAAVVIDNVPNRFSEANGSLRFQEQRIFLDDIRTLYGQIPARIGGSLHTQDGYDLTAAVRAVTAADLLETFELETPVAVSGEFMADLQLVGAIDEPLLQGTASNIQPVRVDRIDMETANARFSITPAGLSFDDIAATLVGGGQVAGNGLITFGDQGGLVFDLRATDLPGDAIASQYNASSDDFRVGRVGANAQIFGPLGDFQTVVQWRAPEATYPGQGEIRIAGGITQFRDTVLQVAGGTVSGEGEIVAGRWQATLAAAQIQLQRFSPDLRGLFGGNLNLQGSLEDFSPEAIRATGDVLFSEGLAIIEDPLSASIRWTGDRLEVPLATARGFRADGFILARLEGEGAPEVTALGLNVLLQNYDINNLPIPTPDPVEIAGLADFVGRLTGTPVAPNVVGQLELNGLAVNSLAFEPRLSGPFELNAQGIDLNVTGSSDRLAIVLDSANRPRSFFVQQDQAIAQGRGEGDRLLAEVTNFPLAALNLAPATEAGLGQVRGQLNGNFDINLETYAVAGEVAIAQPAIGHISGERFATRFRYANGITTISGGDLRLRGSCPIPAAVSLSDADLDRCGSRYLLSGNFNPSAEPQFRGQVVAEPGRVEDVLVALQIFELGDFARALTQPTYGTAADVAAVSVGEANATLLNQLRRFSEIVALQEQQLAQREAVTILPDLAELRGRFTGNIDVAFSQLQGLSADLSLRGADWNWGGYDVKQVIVDGRLDQGVLTLLPLRLQSDDILLTFSGVVGGEQQSGQLRAENLPLSVLQDLFELPINVQGNLNATATLAGSIENPQVTGEVNLTDSSLNYTPVQEARGIFGYNDARLIFNSRIVVEEPEPLRVVGSIPYVFPFMTAVPESDEIRLDVNVRNEGLALLNLFTDLVAWEGGEGDVRLQVRGTTTQPLADGVATFRDATFSARALPEPLTNVTGTVQFNRDRIQVESLQGQFSRGQVTSQGVLPLFTPLQADSPDWNNPLVVSLNQLALNLKGLYAGGVNGEFLLTGTALAPEIGGEIILSDGRVFLPDGTGAALPGVTEAAAADELGGITAPPELSDLRISLGDRLLITRDPLLNFVATGDLIINGPFDDLRPDGEIRLRSGQVNLFTTRFNLARGYDNKAVFRPNQGLDPFLDVRLVTSVPEVTRTPVTTPSDFTTSEIADRSPADFGEVQTIRIQARVEGQASQIFDNLELTSSPSRSENEIIALMGGGFVDTLGRGDSTLAIANLAGSALLTSLQSIIGNTLGLTDFRLFPTTITNENRTATLGLAAEVGFDLTSRLSASVLQILTAEEPTQLNLRYRLNDQFLLRGSTNLSGDTRTVLEYELRF